jgi:putative ABC transport system substrate-binding protein
VELIPIGVHDSEEIEHGVAEFAHGPNGGLIVVGPPSSMQRYRGLVVDLAARYRLPAVHAGVFYGNTNALMSYGADTVEQFRRAASYVDRILKGERPADLPVQAPTKYRLVINLKSAKNLGLTVPMSLLASADEVIE